MRFIAILMALYILTLGFNPCQEIDDSCSSDHPALTNADSTQNPVQSDVCSPFCNCLRCSFSVEMIPFPTSLCGLVAKDLNIGPKYLALPARLGHDIWQPPQLMFFSIS